MPRRSLQDPRSSSDGAALRQDEDCRHVLGWDGVNIHPSEAGKTKRRSRAVRFLLQIIFNGLALVYIGMRRMYKLVECCVLFVSSKLLCPPLQPLADTLATCLLRPLSSSFSNKKQRERKIRFVDPTNVSLHTKLVCPCSARFVDPSVRHNFIFVIANPTISPHPISVMWGNNGKRYIMMAQTDDISETSFSFFIVDILRS